jgi:desulfoferrodoxin (superoxide reductase-like protein)
VGDIEHVMTPEHFISFLDFYVNHKFASRVWLSPETCHPAAAIHLQATEGKLTVLEHCNVHGNWIAEIDL